MLYSGNRRLGIVAVGTPDMNPIYSGVAAIDSGFNTFTSTSLTSNSLISIATGIPRAESDWPKPCEYFNSEILASDFPVNLEGVNEIGVSIPYIAGSGVDGYNIIQNILNTSTGSSFTIENSFIDNKNYKFEIEEISTSGELTYVGGNILLLNPDIPTFLVSNPQVVGGFLLESSGQFNNLEFILRNNNGQIYQITSSENNQSLIYRTNNTIHICGGNI
jgi:hypothetical protein